MKRIFVPIPKTGTTTIHSLIEKYHLPIIPRPPREVCKYPWHPLLSEFIPPQKFSFKNYFVFSISRNPYDRFLSAFSFVCLKNIHFKNLDITFENFVDKFSHYKTYLYNDIVFLPQNIWIKINQNYINQNVFKFEDIFFKEKKWKQFCHQCFTFPIPCIQENKSIHPKWNKMYSSQLKRKVYKIYEQDFDLFKYKRDF